MSDLTTCSRCGKPAPRRELLGLCPGCLLAAGLGSVADATAAGPAARFTPPAASELAPLFPQLEITGLLGCGGMGAVYQARQTNLDRPVALKILPPDIGREPAFAERFAREARALAKLSHPNIVTLYEFGQTGDLFYFLMEYVDGVNLGQLIRDGRVSPREALAVVPQICDALQYAHDAGIVHRDIKPENILLDRRGRVKVADFGLAKLVGQSGAGVPPLNDTRILPVPPKATAASLVMGTPAYMAPEQRERPSEVDHRADIYSLGVVFYQMLTGELPGASLVPPSKKVTLDVRLDEVVLRALEQRPERRYQQASEVKTMVETLASTGALEREAAPSAASRDLPARTPWRHVVIVGRRGGKAVVVWPNVALAFLAVLAVVEFGGALACWLFGGSMGVRAAAVGVLLSVMAVGVGLRRARTTPLARLVDLGSPSDSRPLWQPPASGWGWLVGKVFGLTFTSPAAYACANLSAFGFLGALGFLSRLPVPGAQHAACLYGLCGFFGLIGLAHIVEFGARARRGRTPPQVDERCGAGPSAALAAFALCYALLLLLLYHTASELPERVATHFGSEGRANGWMSRRGYLIFEGVFPLAIGLFFLGLSSLIRVFPASLINIPRKDFWLVPERRSLAAGIIRNYLTGLAALMTLYFGGLHVLTLEANRVQPTQLPMGGMLLVVMAFLIALMLWVIALLMRFAETGEGQVAACAPQAAPVRKGWRWRKKALEVAAGVVIALALKQWVVGAYTIKGDSLAPEVPAGSYVLAWKPTQSFSAGDLVVYRQEGQFFAGRVSGVTSACVFVNRNGTADFQVGRAVLCGRIVTVLWRGTRRGAAPREVVSGATDHSAGRGAHSPAAATNAQALPPADNGLGDALSQVAGAAAAQELRRVQAPSTPEGLQRYADFKAGKANAAPEYTKGQYRTAVAIVEEPPALTDRLADSATRERKIE